MEDEKEYTLVRSWGRAVVEGLWLGRVVWEFGDGEVVMAWWED